MKIALLGNCQLQQIGWLLKHFFELHGLDYTVVWYEPIFALGDKNAPIVPLFDALASADVIYGQYHDNKWNALSTNSLSQYFNIKIVPTLESLASYPQLNYFSEGGLNFNLYTVDFRMLDMYLNNVDIEHAAGCYSQVRVNKDELQIIMENAALRYRSFYDSQKVVFDYSDEYLRAMKVEKDPYLTHNHPNNNQLQWLANQILLDIKCPTLISLANMSEILFDTVVPELGTEFNERYRIRSVEVGLKTACKINYVFFSTYDRAFLEKELDMSNYRRVCNGNV